MRLRLTWGARYLTSSIETAAHSPRHHKSHHPIVCGPSSPDLCNLWSRPIELISNDESQHNYQMIMMWELLEFVLRFYAVCEVWGIHLVANLINSLDTIDISHLYSRSCPLLAADFVRVSLFVDHLFTNIEPPGSCLKSSQVFLRLTLFPALLEEIKTWIAVNIMSYCGYTALLNNHRLQQQELQISHQT